MIRLILVVVFVFLFLVIGCIPAFVLWLIGKKNPGLKDRAAKHIVSGAFRVVLFLAGVRVTTEGTEKIPTDRPVLYVGNHRGFFDIVVSYTLFPGVTGYVAKKEMEHYPLLSNWMRNLYCLFLDREDIKQGLKTILQAADYVKSGISVCIFPEGTRNKNADETEMLPFHDGSFKIAARAKSPIIPIAISNSANIWEANFPKMTPTHVVIEYGKPIIPSELDRDTQRRLGSYTQDIIKEMLIKNKELV